MMAVVQGIRFISTVLLLVTWSAVVQGFSGRNPRAVQPVTREDLPTLQLPKGAPPVDPPKGMTSKNFYPPPYTLIRSGPASFLRRVVAGGKYDQYVWKYMKDYKEVSTMTAQGNADAFLASADDWAEQKYLESLGRREVYDYGKELPTERVILTSAWAITVSLLLGRVAWQLANGNRNLF